MTLQRPRESPGRNAMLAGNRRNRFVAGCYPAGRPPELSGIHFGRAANALAAPARRRHALPRALGERSALEFRKSAHDRIDEDARWRRRIDAQIGNLKINAPLAQPVKLGQRIFGRAVRTVEVPYDEDVSGSKFADDTLIDGPRGRAGRGRFNPKLVAHSLETVDLAVGSLFMGRYTQVSYFLHLDQFVAGGQTRHIIVPFRATGLN